MDEDLEEAKRDEEEENDERIMVQTGSNNGKPSNDVEMMDDEDDDDDDEDEVAKSSDSDSDDFVEAPARTATPSPVQHKFRRESMDNGISDAPPIPTTDHQQPQQQQEEDEEDEERKRFQIELEFVQSLANPAYLNFLAQRGYFKKESFLNYLKYLLYWKEPEYVKYLVYPQCLLLLDMLQHERFLKEILNAGCSKFIEEQLLLIWIHYKRQRDLKCYDPAKMPLNVEKLILYNTPPQSPPNDLNSDSSQKFSQIFTSQAFVAKQKF